MFNFHSIFLFVVCYKLNLWILEVFVKKRIWDSENLIFWFEALQKDCRVYWSSWIPSAVPWKDRIMSFVKARWVMLRGFFCRIMGFFLPLWREDSRMHMRNRRGERGSYWRRSRVGLKLGVLPWLYLTAIIE